MLQQKKEIKPLQLIARLYPDEPNAVAYYALRKRLMKHLTSFIVLKRMEEDPTEVSSVMGTLSLARYLSDVGAERLGWNMLRKAEKMALINEQHDLLNTIYNVQIEKANSEFADDLVEIVQKWQTNKIMADENERANVANSIILKKLEITRHQGRDLQFNKVIQEVLEQYKLREVVSKKPALFYRLMSIARSAVLANRDFYEFEPYIIQQYQQAQNNFNFGPAQQSFKLSLLYMIAHVLYRNRKFQESNNYLQQLYTTLQTEGKNYFISFYPKYVFLKCANDAFLRNIAQAVRLMEELVANKKVILGLRQSLTAQLGLSFLYFAQEAYKKANQVLLHMNYSDNYCEKLMGKEWILKKNLGELLIQYEFENFDLAVAKIKSIQRNFEDLLSSPVYKNVTGFLNLVEQLVLQPNLAQRRAFLEKVDATLEFAPLEREDLQAISFFSWLKSKMVNKPYYDVLLELAYEQ